jgi:hypothetical protein
MEKDTRAEKRPRIKALVKTPALFSSDRTKTEELLTFFTSADYKKKDPFAR